MMKSCTAPARQTPPTSQMRPGREAELRREHRADQRAGAGDRREMVAEQDPAVGGVVVVAVGRVCAGVTRESSSDMTFAAMNAL